MEQQPQRPQEEGAAVVQSSTSFPVTLDDGTTVVTLTMRGLNNDDEIPMWAAFCASAFADKANPPSPEYFQRHYYNDPQRGDASFVRVICRDKHGDNNDENVTTTTMVSSVRIFPRFISSGTASTVYRAGGIGEVCTDAGYRRRGLSKRLLQDAIQIMESNMQLSLLHAAPTFFPVYESAGYSCSISKWSVVTVDMNKLSQHVKTISSRTTIGHAVGTEQPSADSTTGSWLIRHALFPNDTPHLQAIHQVYSEQRFAGCIIRSTEYWNDYLGPELEGSLYVLLTSRNDRSNNNNNKDNNSSSKDEDDDDDDAGIFLPAAWISVRVRGHRHQVREFGCDETQLSTSAALAMLLHHAVSKLLIVESTPTIASIDLHLPTFLVDEISLVPDSGTGRGNASNSDGDHDRNWWSNITPEDDHGWMYKILGDNKSVDVFPPPDRPHLIWPSDSF